MRYESTQLPVRYREIGDLSMPEKTNKQYKAAGARAGDVIEDLAPEQVIAVDALLDLKDSNYYGQELDTTLLGDSAGTLAQNLKDKVIGQPDALDKIVRAYQKWEAGMCEAGRPVSNMLFLGPSGTGKTKTVEALAQSVLGDVRSVLKIDCGEFQHSHEIAKLIGSPPGYLGHRETHPLLSQEVLNQYHTDKMKISFVLFDEVEKASDALWNLLLGIMDKASLTLGDNRRVDFSKAMIFMTGNTGAAEMSSLTGHSMGFTPKQHSNKVDEQIKGVAHAAAKRKFTPEFLNRIDQIVVFRSLGTIELESILSLELGMLQQRIFNAVESAPFVIQVTEAARKCILNEGMDAKYGARFLKRAITRMITDPLSNLIASGQISGGDLIEVDCKDVANTASVIHSGLQNAVEKMKFRRLRIGLSSMDMVDEVKKSIGAAVDNIEIMRPSSGGGGNRPTPVDPMRKIIPYGNPRKK